MSISPTTINPTTATPLIDEKLAFQSGDSFLQTESAEVGTNYNVVALLGSQGSGSSTLLNDIFGTKFSTTGSHFDETTKGIHRSWCPDAKALALDVEGYSGGHGAEIPLSQFVAATSDVIIVSLKQDQIVRHGLQYRQVMETVCRTVLGRYNEEDLLRKPIVLLYVIRDWDGVMDIERAGSRVKAGLAVIWKSVTEMAGVPDAEFDRYFDLGISTLPHKTYDPSGYEEHVALLRMRFVVESPGGITPSITRGDVPLRDVLDHMGNIWNTVRGLINISTERVAIAEKMCPCFVTAILDETKRALKTKFHGNLGAEQFKKLSMECRDKGLRQYDRLAKHYEPSVFQGFRNKLAEAIDAELVERYSLHLANTLYICLLNFSQQLFLLEAASSSIKTPFIDYEALVPKAEDLKVTCVKEFREVCEAARVSPSWSYQREEQRFTGDMEMIIKPLKLEANRPPHVMNTEAGPPKQPAEEVSTPKEEPRVEQVSHGIEEPPKKAEPALPAPIPESMAMVLPTIREISKLSVRLGRILVKTVFKNPFRLR